MTTIAAVSHNGRAYVAGDSAVTSDGEVFLQRAPKVFACGSVLVGACGDSPWCEAWRAWEPHVRAPYDTGVSRDASAFIVRAGIKDVESGDCAILAFAGRLYYAERTGAVYRIAGGCHAIGSGGLVARAILEYTRGLPPRRRLTSALQMAAKLTTETRPPFTVLEGTCKR